MNETSLKKEWDSYSWALPRKDINKMKKKNIVLENFGDYCSHSTIHGITYLGDKNITLHEKIWWLTIFLASLCFCIYMISAAWVQWQQNPVLLSFEKQETPVWEIPFPTVTVCPVNKVKQTVYNYTKLFPMRDSLPPDEYKKFWDISLVCSLIDQYSVEINSSIYITDKMAAKNIFQVAPEMSETIYASTWQNSENKDVFSEHLNKQGLCFTFNAFSHRDMYTNEMDQDTRFMNQENRNSNWIMENGYTARSNMDDYPRRTSQAGFGSGLSFFLIEFIPDIDYICGQYITGYKIMLNNPVEPAQGDRHYILVDKSKKVTIMVKPELITTSTSLKHLTARERKCYYSKEKSLKFFKVYTENNCRRECVANVTEYHCDCVPFYMPHGKGSLICGFGKLKCIAIIEQKILLFEILKRASKTTKTYNEVMKTKEYEIYSKCDCMPSCNYLQFASEVSHTSIRIDKTLINSGLLGDVPEEFVKGFQNNTRTVSAVDIFFKESQFLGLQRTELHNQTDFIANCGGLLGLFMGFSVLSIVEIIYFSTLRLWCKIRKRNHVNSALLPR